MVRIVEIVLIAPNDEYYCLCICRFVGGTTEVFHYGILHRLHTSLYVDP